MCEVGKTKSGQMCLAFVECPSERLGAARRRRPYGSSASLELNFVEVQATKKIIFSLASRPGAAKPKEQFQI